MAPVVPREHDAKPAVRAGAMPGRGRTRSGRVSGVTGGATDPSDDPAEVRRRAEAHLEPALVVAPIDGRRDFVIEHANRAATMALSGPSPVGRQLYDVFPWLPALDLHDVYSEV